MALTFPPRTARQSWGSVFGGKKEKLTVVTLDNSYPTGGYAITVKQLGLDSTIDSVLASPSSNGYISFWNTATGKLMFFSAPGTELANASAALAAQTVQIRATGY